tara:strand:+ start:1083 stop:3710 length:2628 start_codon:yes stop_codon:yes gene_type:complete
MSEKIDILLQIRADLDGLKRAQRESNKLRTNLSGIGTGLKAAAGVFGGFQIAKGLTDAALAGLRFNATIEQQTVAFQTLLGSVAEADERIRSLVEFAGSTPFQLPEVIQANKLLQALTQGALAGEKGMRLVGDAAAAIGVPFQEAAFWIGRLFTGLEGGAPIGEAATRLQEMGIVTSATRLELNELSGTALGVNETFVLMERIFGATAGAMVLQSQTLNGELSTLKDAMTQLLGAITEQPFNDLKVILEAVLVAWGKLPSHVERATMSINNMRKELNAASDDLTTSDVDAFFERLTSSAEQSQERVREMFARIQSITDEEGAATEVRSSRTSTQDERVEALGRLSDLKKEREAIQARYEAELELQGQISQIKKDAATEDARIRQAENQAIKDKADAAAREAAKVKELTEGASKENEKLTSQVSKLNDQLLKATQSDEDRIQYLNDSLGLIDEQTSKRFKEAEVVEDAAQRKTVLDNAQLEAETKRIPILIELNRLEGKISKDKESKSRAGLDLETEQIRLQLDQIKHIKTQIQLTGESATTRAQIAGLIDLERQGLEKLIIVYQEYLKTVTDPAARQQLIGKIQGLRQEQDLAGTEQNRPSRIDQIRDDATALDPTDSAEQFQTIGELAEGAVLSYKTQVGSLFDQIHEGLLTTQEALSGGLAESIEGLITGTMDWNDALENIGQTVVSSIIQSFAKMLANWITTQIAMALFSRGTQATATLSSAASAASLAVAWAPAATAASIATFGAAAAAGTGAYVTALGAGTAAAAAFSAIGLASSAATFQEGGFTGFGPPSRPAGIVHAGEFVTPADVVTKAGGPGAFANQVDSIRSGGSGGGQNLILVDDRKSAERLLESSEGEARIVSIMEMNKGALL